MRKSTPIIVFCAFLFISANHGALSQNRASRFSTPAETGDRKTMTLVFPGNDCYFCAYFIKGLYTEAFQRLGYDFRLIAMPPARALIESNAGNVDGETSRIHDLNKENRYPNLIRVEEPIAEMSLTVYSIESLPRVNSWQDFGQVHLPTCYIRGEKIAEYGVRERIDATYCREAENTLQAIRLLTANRIKTVITLPKLFEPVIVQQEFKNANIRAIGQLGSIEFFPYLHKKHRDLVVELAVVLRQMKADGTFDRIMESAKAAADVE